MDNHNVKVADMQSVCKCHGHTILELKLLEALGLVMSSHGGVGPGGIYRCDCKGCALGRAAIKMADEDAADWLT
jgi:hypothetical protein